MTASSSSAATLLAELRALGVKVQPCGATLRYRPRDVVTPALLQRLQTHKAELLELLTPPWNQSEADDLIAKACRRLDAQGWPSDLMDGRRLGHAMDALDVAYLAGELERLREAVCAFHTVLDAAAPVSGVAEDDDEAFICRVIERNLGLARGSLTLWEPIRSSDWQPASAGSGATPRFAREGRSRGR